MQNLTIIIIVVLLLDFYIATKMYYSHKRLIVWKSEKIVNFLCVFTSSPYEIF